MRRCLNPECQRFIEDCNGFVVGRDFLAFLEGKISWIKVREFCGKCVLKFEPGSEAWSNLVSEKGGFNRISPQE